ncbi:MULTISPECIES: transferrin-binding protein-like solute binding protein [Neisseriaceae]|uniref:transferrin-binding protein-like solute binding protein n=1 Tax=Neisseriaceae TaxID=481 RepID=UPI000A53EE14|nr:MULTISPECIES: transferrin-binding protein-like solute binding protein [Neisseriaceae]MDU4438110.1 transferrin-binding protein-like solute binding protein [Neisseria sp.]
MKKVLALICTATLAACGGGGGNSTPSSQSTPNAGPSNPSTSQKPATPPSTKTPAKPETGKTPTTPKTPATPAVPAAAQQTVGGNSIAIDNSNIKHIRVDGVDFDLTQSGGVSLNNWKGKVPGFISGIASGEPKSVQKFLVNTASANATAGVLEVNGKKQAFFSGHFTPAAELPKGQVHYNTSVASMHSGANYNITRTELTANFDSKKLTGIISRNAEFGGNIAVNAQISGNKFDQSGATEVKGGFFGKNAAEVAGGFSSGNTVGAFVGSKK